MLEIFPIDMTSSLVSANGLVDWRKKVATIRVKISKEFSFVLKDIEVIGYLEAKKI
ncbi:unnamed protein product [Brassica rapa subsp. narinosa]